MSDETLFDPGELKPWERQEGEPPRAYTVFQTYLELGPGRNLRELSELIHPPSSSSASSRGEAKRRRESGQVSLWSRTWAWQARCQAWDDLLAGEARAKLLARHVEMAAKHAEVAELAIDKVREKLEKMQPRDLTGGQVASLLTASITQHRLALGMDDPALRDVERDEAEFDETPETLEALDEYARRRSLARATS